MEILRETADWVLCVKPAGVLSTDEPGGMPSLVREATGAAEIRTVHRLDQVVGGLMVLAKSKASASQLGRQIMDGTFEKQYLAVLHGVLPQAEGRLTDLLLQGLAVFGRAAQGDDAVDEGKVELFHGGVVSLFDDVVDEDSGGFAAVWGGGMIDADSGAG